MLWWIPQVKSCRHARKKQSPFMLRTLYARLILYHISPLPALSLSISHDICFVAPPPPNNHPTNPVSHRLTWYINAAAEKRPLQGRKQVTGFDIDGQSCMHGFNTRLICSRGMRAHNWSSILSLKLGEWVFFYVVAVKLEFKFLLFITQPASLFLSLSFFLCSLPQIFSIRAQLLVCVYLGRGSRHQIM